MKKNDAHQNYHHSVRHREGPGRGKMLIFVIELILGMVLKSRRSSSPDLHIQIHRDDVRATHGWSLVWRFRIQLKGWAWRWRNWQRCRHAFISPALSPTPPSSFSSNYYLTATDWKKSCNYWPNGAFLRRKVETDAGTGCARRRAASWRARARHERVCPVEERKKKSNTNIASRHLGQSDKSSKKTKRRQ